MDPKSPPVFTNFTTSKSLDVKIDLLFAKAHPPLSPNGWTSFVELLTNDVITEFVLDLQHQFSD